MTTFMGRFDPSHHSSHLTPYRHRTFHSGSPPKVLSGLLLLLVFMGCGDDSNAPDPELEGGVLATFRVEGETFQFWTDNAETIQDLIALESGASGPNIPNGPLLAGPGRGDHNLPYSWHLDPQETEMAENTIEVCSGLPSFVEEELDYWLDLGRYCPWSAELAGLEDYR